jgi:hypothetical protein
VPSPGFEPTTVRLRVRLPKHSATTLHREGTYLNVEMYQRREPLLEDGANKNLPNTYFRGPKKGRQKKDRTASSLQKDCIERLNESRDAGESQK